MLKNKNTNMQELDAKILFLKNSMQNIKVQKYQVFTPKFN